MSEQQSFLPGNYAPEHARTAERMKRSPSKIHPQNIRGAIPKGTNVSFIESAGTWEVNFNDEMEKAHERARSMGAHPSTMSTAPVPRLVDLPNAYRRFDSTPADAVWPRATVRPTAGLNASEVIWSAKIWVAPGKEARVNGVWVTRTSTSQEEVFWWAQKTVKEFREMAVFHRTGALGSRQRRWAPEW